MDDNYQTILNPAEKFKLKPLDFITVRSQDYQNSNQIITISGAVNFPGHMLSLVQKKLFHRLLKEQEEG